MKQHGSSMYYVEKHRVLVLFFLEGWRGCQWLTTANRDKHLLTLCMGLPLSFQNASTNVQGSPSK